jgi:hypothetical protein
MKPALSFIAVFAALALAGCGSFDSRTQKLSLGMTKPEATALLGSEYKTVGARQTPDASNAEVIRYDDEQSGELLLYFRDGKLVQWGDIRILDNMPEAIQ